MAVTSSSDVVKAKFITKASFTFQHFLYPYVIPKCRKHKRKPPIRCNLYSELDVQRLYCITWKSYDARHQGSQQVNRVLLQKSYRSELTLATIDTRGWLDGPVTLRELIRHLI